MRRVSYHENIVNLQGIILCPHSGKNKTETSPTTTTNDEDKTNFKTCDPGCDGSFYLVLEYCSHGSLLNFLRNHDHKYTLALRYVKPRHSP